MLRRFFAWLALCFQLLLINLGGRSYGRVLVTGLLLASWSSAFYYLGYAVERNRLDGALDELARIEGFEGVLDGKDTALKLVAVRTQAALLRESSLQMRDELRRQQRDLAELNEQLYFYRSVIAPEDLPKGVSVLSMQLGESSDEGRFPFELVLRASGVKGKRVKGNVRLGMTGTVDGVEKKLRMDAFYRGEKQFSFQYFQRLKGAIVVPEGYTPINVEVWVQVAQRDPVFQSFAWRGLLASSR